MTVSQSAVLLPAWDELYSRHHRATREAEMFSRLCVEATLDGHPDRALRWARRADDNAALAAELVQQKRDLRRIEALSARGERISA